MSAQFRLSFLLLLPVFLCGCSYVEDRAVLSGSAEEARKNGVLVSEFEIHPRQIECRGELIHFQEAWVERDVVRQSEADQSPKLALVVRPVRKPKSIYHLKLRGADHTLGMRAGGLLHYELINAAPAEVRIEVIGYKDRDSCGEIALTARSAIPSAKPPEADR